MSQSNPVYAYRNRAGNTYIPSLDYSKWFNRVRGYAWSTYIMVATSVVCGFIALALDEKSDGEGWTRVRAAWQDWKKNIGDIAAEKGLQRLVPVTYFASPDIDARENCGGDFVVARVVVHGAGNARKVIEVIEFTEQLNRKSR
jgi:hypothetical protein